MSVAAASTQGEAIAVAAADACADDERLLASTSLRSSFGSPGGGGVVSTKGLGREPARSPARGGFMNCQAICEQSMLEPRGSHSILLACGLLRVEGGEVGGVEALVTGGVVGFMNDHAS